MANVVFWVARQVESLFASDPLGKLPRAILWAWERPEDLSFLDCDEAGVAYLATTIRLGNGHMTVSPRLQSLRVPKGCPMVAVARIEAEGVRPERSYAKSVAGEIVALAAAPVAAIQIDFDAAKSQREFYRLLLEDVRRRLPRPIKLSITALASWCLHDDWIRDLPIDEAVPMLFRMGADGGSVRRYLESGNDFRVAACRHSIGISTDEGMARVPGGRRVYIFHPQTWSRAAAEDILKTTRPWR